MQLNVNVVFDSFGRILCEDVVVFLDQCIRNLLVSRREKLNFFLSIKMCIFELIDCLCACQGEYSRCISRFYILNAYVSVVFDRSSTKTSGYKHRDCCKTSKSTVERRENSIPILDTLFSGAPRTYWNLPGRVHRFE